MHVADRIYADTPHQGGWIINTSNVQVVSSSTVPALARNARGDWSFNRTAGGVETIQFRLALSNVRRLVESMDMQEQFGGSTGPIPFPGKPPFTDATQLVPPSAFPNKDFLIDNIAVCYLVGVVGLTSATLRVDKTIFANNVALAITALGSQAYAAGQLVTQANPYVITTVFS